MDNKIRQYREKLGLSQKELARRTGISDHSIAEYELDRHLPSVFYAICLAQALGTTVEELFSP